MTNPADVLDNLIDALRNIPEIVEEMDGNQDRIFAYHDQYPTLTSYELKIDKAPSPSIVGVWQETGPTRVGQIESWAHRFSLFIRARRVPDGGSAQEVGYYRIFQALINGVPTNGNNLPLVNYQVHDACYPMELPVMARKTDAEGVNFFEVLIQFNELQA